MTPHPFRHGFRDGWSSCLDRFVGQKPLQVVGHLLGREVPSRPVLGDGLQHDGLQVARDGTVGFRGAGGSSSVTWCRMTSRFSPSKAGREVRSS